MDPGTSTTTRRPMSDGPVTERAPSPTERPLDRVRIRRRLDDSADRRPLRRVRVLEARAGEDADDQEVRIELAGPRQPRHPGHALGRRRLAEDALDRGDIAVRRNDLVIGDRVDPPPGPDP